MVILVNMGINLSDKEMLDMGKLTQLSVVLSMYELLKHSIWVWLLVFKTKLEKSLSNFTVAHKYGNYIERGTEVKSFILFAISYLRKETNETVY